MPTMTQARSILPYRLKRARFTTIAKDPSFRRYFAAGDDAASIRTVLTHLYEAAAVAAAAMRRRTRGGGVGGRGGGGKGGDWAGAGEEAGRRRRPRPGGGGDGGHAAAVVAERRRQRYLYHVAFKNAGSLPAQWRWLGAARRP